MSNISVVSEWHDPAVEEDKAAMEAMLRRGDLLEFQRGSYCHWAVYAGEVPLVGRVRPDVDYDGDDLLQMCHMVIHRSNPNHQSTGLAAIANASSASVSNSRSRNGVGEVVYESLEDVWRDSPARINNHFDEISSPYPQTEILERASRQVFRPEEERGIQMTYNLITNNCEHFATWARNGWAASQQVALNVQTAATYTAAAAVAILPRSISLPAGLAAMAVQGLRYMRRRPQGDDQLALQEGGGAEDEVQYLGRPE